jgi:hypothetical protein
MSDARPFTSASISSGESSSMTLQAPRDYARAVFHLFLGIVAMVAGIAAASILARSSRLDESLFLIVWIGGVWGLGAAALFSGSWHVVGNVVIDVQRDRIRVSRRLRGVTVLRREMEATSLTEISFRQRDHRGKHTRWTTFEVFLSNGARRAPVLNLDSAEEAADIVAVLRRHLVVAA